MTYFIAPIQINSRASLECEAAIDEGTIHDGMLANFDGADQEIEVRKVREMRNWAD